MSEKLCPFLLSRSIVDAAEVELEIAIIFTRCRLLQFFTTMMFTPICLWRLQLLVQHPQLIERPLVVSEQKGALARPLENLVEWVAKK